MKIFALAFLFVILLVTWVWISSVPKVSQFSVVGTGESESLIKVASAVYFESKASRFGFFVCGFGDISKIQKQDYLITYYGDMKSLRNSSLGNLADYSSGEYEGVPAFPSVVDFDIHASAHGYLHFLEKAKSSERGLKQAFIFIGNNRDCKCIYFF